ncbi:MAG: TldD/PmbA family protein [Candidatus Hodarchaeales archaeon]|jgi:TldD protein
MYTIEDILEFAVNEGEKAGADFVTARFEDLKLQTLIREKDTMKDVLSSRRIGIGITAHYKGVEGFSYTAALSQPDVKETVLRAVKIAKASEPMARLRLPFEKDGKLPDLRTPLEYKVNKHPLKYDLAYKKDLVDRASSTALSYNFPKANSIIGRYGELSGLKMIYTSENRMVSYKPIITDLRMTVIVKDPKTGELLRAGDGHGGAFGLDRWEQKGRTPEELATNAYNWAVEKCDAKKPPAGKHRVLTGPKLTAVLAHESFGHLTEADGVVEKSSPLTGKIGQQIANDGINVVDRGVNPGEGGLWLPFDDEAVPTANTNLVEGGILKSYLHNRGTEHAVPDSGGLSGNARALAYRFPPIPRMKNTIFLPGDVKTEEEMLELLGTGIYSIDTSGGSVSMSNFQFFALRGYWVENGEKKYPLRDHLLTGNILQCLLQVEALSQESVLLSGYFGGCGKGGQNGLSVGMGAPHMLFSEIQVGGEN